MRPSAVTYDHTRDGLANFTTKSKELLPFVTIASQGMANTPKVLVENEFSWTAFAMLQDDVA